MWRVSPLKPLLILALLLLPSLSIAEIDTSLTEHAMIEETSQSTKLAQAACLNDVTPLMPMVAIPAGVFQMGTYDARPIHRVDVKPFLMGKYEVTQSQWKAVMGKNPSAFMWGNADDYPVDSVSWNDVQEFIRKFNAKTGKHFRLPTEAERDYAGRAGSMAPMSWESSYTGDFAWFAGNAGGESHPVGQKKANAFGLYDMFGNVLEWVQDCWHKNYDGAPIDGSAWLKGECSDRVVRGGSWAARPGSLRSSARSFRSAKSRMRIGGFRLAHDVCAAHDQK